MITPSGAFRSILLEQTVDTSRWPDDDEFKRMWITTSFYKKFKRVRMILEALDTEMQTDKTEKIANKEKLTVEHLMPQSWEQHWPLTEDGDSNVRNSQLHKVGNLTLLTKKLNPAVSNGPLEQKRKKILEHSAITMNRQFQEVTDWGGVMFKV